MTSAITILSALIIIVSCKNYRQPVDNTLTTDNNDPDTVRPVITTSFRSVAFPNVFEAAFSNDLKVTEGDMTYSFIKLDIGKIKIESGKLIACDPVVMSDASPFTQNFPIGDFPVQLAMAKTYNDERVAFSRVVFSDKIITKWEFALKKGQKPITLKDSGFYCYGVDAGTGIFIDSIANNSFNKKGRSEWDNTFVTKAELNGYKGYMHDFDGHNLATFSTGYGDGCYATYIGFDDQGNVCQVLTDFGLVAWWNLEEQK